MTEPTNEDRAARIQETIATYIGERDHSGRMPDYEDTDITDLLADLMHFCRDEEIDFSACLSMAERHFQEEVEEEKEYHTTTTLPEGTVAPFHCLKCPVPIPANCPHQEETP